MDVLTTLQVYQFLVLDSKYLKHLESFKQSTIKRMEPKVRNRYENRNCNNCIPIYRCACFNLLSGYHLTNGETLNAISKCTWTYPPTQEELDSWQPRFMTWALYYRVSSRYCPSSCPPSYLKARVLCTFGQYWLPWPRNGEEDYCAVELDMTDRKNLYLLLLTMLIEL